MSQNSTKSRRDFLKGAAVVGGASSLGACVGAQTQPYARYKHSPSFYPKHNERTKGWMRFMWQKATTPDDWGYSEDIELPWGIKLPLREIDWTEDGKGPHPWWDQYSAAPMLSYPRFDLTDSSYVIMMMADQTPAWREAYTRILDELATRHTSYWAAIDWNTFIGPSPDRDKYVAANAPGSQAWPERVHGNYDSPGWTANGVEPWGLQPDPIGADGNLFFRGWLNLLLSIYKYVSGDDKWEKPWEIAGYENEKFEWTQPRIVEHLHRQYTDHPEGPQCENTKIWPICNSAAGLGMYLSDQLGVSNSHGAFEDWIQFMRDNYVGINAQNQIEWTTLYYDPIEDFKVNTPGATSAINSAFFLLPQSPELAIQIYDAAAMTLGWRDPRKDILPSANGMAMAKALGDHTAISRLSAAAERYSDPKWFGDDMDKFGWWFNNGEPWPRGQRSAQQMISEINEGNWVDAFKVHHLDKYTAPTLEGVEYPSLGVDSAWNDKDSGVLHIGTYAGDRGRVGDATSWQITNLPNAAEAIVICDGTTISDVQVLDANTIRVPTDIGQHQYQVYTGYFGQEVVVTKPDPSQYTSASIASATRRTAEQNVKAAEVVIASAATGCACCVGVV